MSCQGAQGGLVFIKARNIFELPVNNITKNNEKFEKLLSNKSTNTPPKQLEM